ncbi:hypothetical protein DWX73_03090 [Coprococcus sp. AF21-14LB]|nr:hypothetical protein DWX73_03090 [Coprococcus sp. AF21-14LB]
MKMYQTYATPFFVKLDTPRKKKTELINTGFLKYFSHKTKFLTVNSSEEILIHIKKDLDNHLSGTKI